MIRRLPFLAFAVHTVYITIAVVAIVRAFMP